MDGHCFGYSVRRALIAAALVFTATAPAAATEPTPRWLSAVGDFVRAGLAPPRTAEDVLRESNLAVPSSAAPAQTPAVHLPAPAAPTSSGAERLAAPMPAPVPLAAPEPVAVPAPPPAPAKPDLAVKKPEPSVQPGPRAVATPAEIRPRPVVPAAVRPVQAPPPPEPLTGSRIAATATLDQAIKLGGPVGLYGQRVKKPPTAP